jgi:hypothetical protein
MNHHKSFDMNKYDIHDMKGAASGTKCKTFRKHFDEPNKLK